MIKHHRGAERGKPLARSYDYVIVGAGSAGCVVARRLLDGTDATVLLLEAGGPGEDVASLSNPPQWVENFGSRYDWAYHYEPSPHVAWASQGSLATLAEQLVQNIEAFVLGSPRNLVA